MSLFLSVWEKKEKNISMSVDIVSPMAMFGLTIIASLSTNSVIKGLMMGCVGLVLACIGIDPVLGSVRFTFGSTYLMGGIPMIPVVIGLFSMSQVFSTLKDPVQITSRGRSSNTRPPGSPGRTL